MPGPPRAFVSYSHDSPLHKGWVLKLASDLRSNGVDAVLDQWDLSPGDDIAVFMERGLKNAQRVIVVCSKEYVERANNGKGGVGYEKMIVTAELIEHLGTKKFIPIIRGSGKPPVPTFLGYRLYIDFEDDAKYQSSLETLLRELLNVPDPGKPPIGPNPFGPEGNGDIVVGTGDSVLQPARNFPEELVPPSLGDATQAIENLKVLITQPSHPMQLNDLLMPLANEVRSTIEASGITDYAVPPTQEEFVLRVRTADEATNKLSQLFAFGCYWADDSQARTFAKALLRVVINPMPQGAFYQAWESVARYSALRVMYAGGVAASANDAFDVLRQLLVEPQLRPRPSEPEIPLVQFFHHGAGFMQRHWKWLPGRERHYTPLSDYLEESLRPAWRQIANDDDQISAAFDKFEFFQALIYGDIAGDDSHSPLGFWAPLGSFIWRRRDLFDRVRAEIQKSGKAWKPLKVGLFSESPERAKDLIDKLEAFVEAVRGQIGIF
ncbi:MAG: toll/interleukin-1 receptor domain-containing protein [Candidatus Sulfopaludibacter sp.]|nr:toll/interleukin-1 receptor domain-containing protein [Candidatus Sulfopaludibacter sp.]